MKAEDLMIGDWVYYSYANPFVTKVIDVCSHHGDEHFIRCKRDEKDNLYKQDQLEDFNVGILRPIPITPEILEKNCFYSVNECIFETPISEEDLIRLIHVDKGWTVDAQIYAKGVNIGYGYFKYVHELQHALKLCGIEKDIIL